jgi:hypothetical protein
MTGYAIFVHDHDGDMGYGQIVGPFRDGEAADKKAETIRRVGLQQGRDIECVVVETRPGATAARNIVRGLFG